jgi:hypothetical protein
MRQFLPPGAVDLVTFNQVVEAVAAADASPTWRLAQAVASSHAAGFLDPKIAREVFGAPDALVAWGPPAGVAKAIIVDGGYRVTGKWRFGAAAPMPTGWAGIRRFSNSASAIPSRSVACRLVRNSGPKTRLPPRRHTSPFHRVPPNWVAKW